MSNRLKNILLSLISLAVAYALAEVLALSTGILEPATSREKRRFMTELFRPDQRYGYRVRENLTGLKISWLDENVSMSVTTDDKGFRNKGLDYDKARVFVIGDSFAFGAWVKREETFYGVMQRTLAEPVISLGVGGFGLAEYAMLARDYIPKRRSVVLIALFANDLGAIPPVFAPDTRVCAPTTISGRAECGRTS